LRKQSKIGTVFFASMVALAGLGASYAGFSDLITVYGDVDTGTVDIELTGEFSGTWVYKDLITHEVVILQAPSSNPDYLLVAHSKAMADPTGQYDVYMEWENIFPCIDFEANFEIHYAGNIPAHITIGDFCWDASGYDFTQYMTFEAYDEDGYLIEEWPLQMHYCDTFTIVITVHLEQDDDLQDLNGAFWFNVNAIQWYDPCGQPPPNKVVELPDSIVNAVFAHPGVSSYWDTTLSNVPPGYDVQDGTYVGWCVDQNTYIVPGQVYTMELYSSYDPANPYADPDWPYVNWIINNKPAGATKDQIQDAIWYFIDGGYTGSDPVVLQLIADALAYGADFIPGPGQWCAVVLWANPSYQHGYTVQPTFIEVDP